MIRIKRYKLTFISIPKTASTSLRKFIIDNLVSSDDIVYEPPHITKAEAIDLKLSSSFDTFCAVIRHPLEVQLSRYFYYSRLGRIPEQSPIDFHNRIVRGKGLLDVGSEWDKKPQHMFIDNKDWLWCYDMLNIHCLELLEQCNIQLTKELPKLNVSSERIPTSALLPWYYTRETKELSEHYHKVDLELYNSVKHRNLQ